MEALCEISSFDFDGELFNIGGQRYLETGELLTDQDISEREMT